MARRRSKSWACGRRSQGTCAGGECTGGALVLVSRGEAPFGIVYQTDAAADPNVKIAGVFPAEHHPPIIYPVALTTKVVQIEAQLFFWLILSRRSAAPVLEAKGSRS